MQTEPFGEAIGGPDRKQIDHLGPLQVQHHSPSKQAEQRGRCLARTRKTCAPSFPPGIPELIGSSSFFARADSSFGHFGGKRDAGKQPGKSAPRTWGTLLLRKYVRLDCSDHLSLEEQLIAKRMLEKIAHLEPSPEPLSASTGCSATSSFKFK
jgi:hypothetical protein